MQGASGAAPAFRAAGDDAVWQGATVEATAPLAPGVPSRSLLRRAATAMDRTHGAAREEDGAEALALWRGLVDGRWALVDRFEYDGRRYLVARRNEHEALSPRERQVVAHVVMGRGNKFVAHALGVSTSSVATHLAAAMRKLGVRSRAELVGMAGTLGASRT